MHACASEHSPDTDFKTPKGGSSQPGRLWLFRQPVVRSGDATHRPAVPPRRPPFPAAESLVAPVIPSPTIDVFAIGDTKQPHNTHKTEFLEVQYLPGPEKT